jgi:[amino group carrier protein]-lysine/ornithine hydrolase
MSEAATLIGLVEHYSPSGNERAAVEWLVKRMHMLGFTEAFVDEAGNAVGKMGDGPRQVILLGHIDTVPGEIPVRVEADVLHGRGCVDAKGALACFVDATTEVGKVDGWQLIVIGVVEEEGNSEGARYVAPRYAPDFTIIGEPNRWERVALGYKGSAWADVSIQRPQGHSASWEPTASEQAVETWLRIKRVAEDFNRGKERVFEKVLLSLQSIETGADDFQQWARLQVATRLPLEISPQAWYQRLEEITTGESNRPEATVTPVGFPLPAWECQKNTPLVRAFLHGIRSQGGAPSFVYKTGTADLNVVAPAWKCPALVYGPGDSAYDHTPNEQVSLEEYARAVRVLVESLKTLMK